MTEFRPGALEDFVNTTDGDTHPVYIGREGILTMVEGYANASWKGEGAPIHGVGKAATIIQGAPGADKSAFLDELKARSALTRAHMPNQPRVVIISSEDLLTGLPDALELIGVAGGLSSDRWKGISSRLALGIDLEAVRAEAALSWTAPDIPRPDTVLALAKQLPAKTWQGPVIVCIDEAQRLPEDRYAPHALFLQAIHDGRSTLPLSLVLGGLGDTANAVDGMGLTRLAVREIGALSMEPDPERGGYIEVMDLMLGFCRHFGIRPADQESRLMALAAPCEGWPRHLHFALQALGRGALKSEGDLAIVDWARITREAADSRLQYYRLQQSGKMDDSRILVARVMQDFRNGMGRSDITAIILRSAENRPGLQLPDDMTAEAFREHLLHRGVLHMGMDRRFHCPIPSFRSFLIRAGGLDPGRCPEQGQKERDSERDLDFSP